MSCPFFVFLEYLYVKIEELYLALADTCLHLHLVLRAGPALVGRVPVCAGGNNSSFEQIFFNKKYFLQNLFPPNPSYEQTNVFLYASAASVIGAIVFSKGAPYRKPLYSNGSKCFSTDKYFYFVCVCSDHGYLGRGCLCHRHLHVALQLPGLRREAQLQDRPPPGVPNHCCDRNHC